MIQGENLSDALLILQGLGKAQSSGLFFLGKEWLVLRMGKIVSASVGISFLLYGFKTLPWKWLPAEVVSGDGIPFDMALLETLHETLRFRTVHCR